MQPDLLSPEKEENPPEPLFPQAVLPEQPSVVKTADVKPSHTMEKKRSKTILAYLGLGALVLLLIAAIGWVGFWAYNLNTQLTSTQQQLTALQADHEQLQKDYAALQSENEKLNAELTQTRTDLEKAKTDLVAAQSDMAKSRDEKNDLDNRITKAGKLAEILYTWTNISGPGDLIKIDKLITESNNQALKVEWDNFTKAQSEDAFGKFLEVLILAMRDSLK